LSVHAENAAESYKMELHQVPSFFLTYSNTAPRKLSKSCKNLKY
jgi:hypothetical protein